MKKGFTLVELLVVVAIIAILAVIGMAIFSGATKNANEAKKKADLNAIAKAMEANYDPVSGTYKTLEEIESSAFAGGAQPTPPEGGTYNIVYSGGNTGFAVCADLEGAGSSECDPGEAGCTCTQSNQGQYVAAGGGDPTPATYACIGGACVESAGGTDFASCQATCAPPASYKRVFVTSTTYNGNLGGISGADSKCQTQATAAGMGSSTWMAWISDTSTTSPSTRFTPSSGEYRLVDGTTIIANSWTDLTDGSILAFIDRNESGTSVAATNVWTSTTTAGAPFGSATCTDWTLGTTGNGRSGNTASTTFGWTSNTSPGCSTLLPLYCFEQ